MKRRSLFFVLLFFIIPVCVFSQAAPTSSGLRDYVGLINQTYHPGIVSFFEKMKEDLAKKSGNETLIKAVDIFLRGDVGSGFVYSDTRGNLYVITNNHVIAQAYSLSITFERQDGVKRRFDNLKIIAADEEHDIALLAFAPGDRPVASGLSFLTRTVEEGEDVYSAGFPGLGTTPLWQFGRGMVSNSSARFPRSLEDDTIMGPFIQHTAEIDPGNSGGPLLVVNRNATGGYSVAGINTLKATRRQAANFAIPISTIQTFITSALNPRPETYKAKLDERLKKFVEGLETNKAVYPHISEYLSTICVGENAEYALGEMYDKGSYSARAAFIKKMEDDGVVEAMGYAVAWTIENSFKSTGRLNASINEITGEGEEYHVVFTINKKDHDSKWVYEYGSWRIRTFGTVAAGDQEMLSKKQRQRETAESLHIDSYSFHIEAGYATLFSKASAAFYASIDFSGFGLKLYYVDSNFFAFGAFLGYRGGFQIGNFGLMPFLRVGMDFQVDDKHKQWKKNNNAIAPPIAFMIQGGLKVTTSWVPGLFAGMGYQYNLFGLHGFGENASYSKLVKDLKLMRMGLSFTVGYAF